MCSCYILYKWWMRVSSQVKSAQHKSLNSHKSMAPVCEVCILALVWGFQGSRWQSRAQCPSPDCQGSLGDGLWALLTCGWASKGRAHLWLLLPSVLSVPGGAGWALSSDSNLSRFALFHKLFLSCPSPCYWPAFPCTSVFLMLQRWWHQNLAVLSWEGRALSLCFVLVGAFC